MEEDRDILNEFVEKYIDCLYEVYKTSYVDELCRAVENILNELDRLQKENELAKETIKKHCSDMDNINNILAKLQKENEELKKRQIYLVNERRELEKIAFESNENYIPKEAIRDKIEELKAYTGDYLYYEDISDILKELLGE